MPAYNPGLNYKYTSGYGQRMLLGKPEFHPGIDFSAPIGADRTQPGGTW